MEAAAIYCSGSVESWGDDLVLENFQGISNTCSGGWGGGTGRVLHRGKDQRLQKEPLILSEHRAETQEWTIMEK